MAVNSLFPLGLLEQKAIRLYVEEQVNLAIAAALAGGGQLTAANVAFSSGDFTATNVAAALQELYDAANP